MRKDRIIFWSATIFLFLFEGMMPLSPLILARTSPTASPVTMPRRNHLRGGIGEVHLHTLHQRTHPLPRTPNLLPSIPQTIAPAFNIITLLAIAHSQSWLTNFVCGMNAPARSERPQAFNKVIRLWEGTHHGYQGNKVLIAYIDKQSDALDYFSDLAHS